MGKGEQKSIDVPVVVPAAGSAAAPPPTKQRTGVLLMCGVVFGVVALLAACASVFPRRWLLLCLGEVR